MQLQGECIPNLGKQQVGYRYSAEGYALTRQFEGLRLQAYRDQAGVWTVGYGHTGLDVTEGMTVTEAEAEVLLGKDVARALACVEQAVKVELSQGQVDALVDFVFNLGCGSLRGSTLLRLVNAGEFVQAAEEFPRWAHIAGKVVPGLLKRRLAEKAIFQS
ncbi:MAG TPA: lysozyme [Edaphobacter sp.]|nr:lysozyme [Edaphobacter sp.]